MVETRIAELGRNEASEVIERSFVWHVDLQMADVAAQPRREAPSAAATCSAPPGFGWITDAAFNTARSASFTAASVGNASATSSSSTMILPASRRRSAYLPRTPPFIVLKSYSGRRSLSALILVVSPFPPGRLACTDEPQFVPGSLDVADDQ